jgi:hypothetical protein
MSDIQKINKASDAGMSAVDNSVVEIQVGFSLSRGGVFTSSREGSRGKTI